MKSVGELLPFALTILMLGLLIGTGVLMLDKFMTTSPNTLYVINESILLRNNTNVALTHGNITEFVQIINASSDVFPSSNYSVDLTNGNVNATGFLTGTSNSTCSAGATGGRTCYVSYRYKEYNTPTATALGSARNETGGIATSWLSLLVTISLLSLVIGIIVSSFGGTQQP